MFFTAAWFLWTCLNNEASLSFSSCVFLSADVLVQVPDSIENYVPQGPSFSLQIRGPGGCKQLLWVGKQVNR